MAIKILLVDDHGLVRTGLRHILSEAPGFDVVGEADSGEAALALMPDLLPDVVIMDIHMAGMGGIEATRRLLLDYPDTRVIALTVLSEMPFPERLREVGALGYLTKGCSAQELLDAITSVRQGRPYLAKEVTMRFSDSRFGRVPESPFEQLSRREVEIMLLILQGMRSQDIADTLYLSPKTVSTHRRRIHHQLGVDTDIGPLRMALRYGLLEEK
jgi:two-component system invasion response regulator UvrY